jgi:enhancing lycopene biosynthesis protein 2
VIGRRAAVLLSGCGVKDGTEIHEAVSALIALEQGGFSCFFIAPDVPQKRSLNHQTGAQESPRSVLSEAARIARGPVIPLEKVDMAEFDVLVIPGGLGAATTLCDFAEKGSDCRVLPSVADLVKSAHSMGKPIAAMCIAPVILAGCIPGVTITLGGHPDTVEAAERMGAVHEQCEVDQAVVDVEKRVVTTPAYMMADGPLQVFSGAESMVSGLNSLLS